MTEGTCFPPVGGGADLGRWPGLGTFRNRPLGQLPRPPLPQMLGLQVPIGWEVKVTLWLSPKEIAHHTKGPFQDPPLGLQAPRKGGGSSLQQPSVTTFPALLSLLPEMLSTG